MYALIFKREHVIYLFILKLTSMSQCLFSPTIQKVGLRLLQNILIKEYKGL